MIFAPADQRLVMPTVVGTGLVALITVLLFQLGSGLAEAQEPPPNSPGTGAPIIIGMVQASETLTVDTSEISDGDGLVNATFGYQWISNDGTTDTDIAYATRATYIIKPWDLGNYIEVRVNFTDDAGNEETLTSVATTAVEASPNKTPTGAPFLSGMAEAGQALKVLVFGISDANGMRHATLYYQYATFSYQWIRSDETTDVDIHDANGSSYTLTDADEGKTIKVRVSFIDDGANSEALTSSATATVAARPSTSELSAPTSLSARRSQGEDKGIDLEWNAPEGTVTGYQILRNEIPTRSRWWDPYSHGCTPLMEVHITDTGSDATTYTDTDVAEGALYVYSVRAINSDGVGRKSSSSTQLQYRPHGYWPNGVPGSPWRAPTNLASTQIKIGIGLTWDSPEGEVAGYQILRRIPEQCEVGYRVHVENTNSTDTHWADRDVVAGTRYEYHVRAINDVGAGRLDTRNSTSFRPAPLVVGPEPNSPAAGAPTITGTAQVGETLTADPSGIADADGMYWARFSYQWLSSRDTEITGATKSTYTLQAPDATKLIKVRITFTDDAGYEESVTSEATGAVSSNVPGTGAPFITGTVAVGETLTANTSGIEDTDGLDNVSFSYQWILSDGPDDWDIVGATGATYAITAADVDKAIKLRVNFTDDKGSVESLTSSATAVVPVEVSFEFSIEGTTVTCDSYNVHIVNVPKKECDDPSSIDQGASEEIEVEIEVARSVNSQLYKFRFHIYQMEDSIGHQKTVEANDLCLDPGLADSVSMEVTPDGGTGNFTYTDEGTIFNLCPAGTYQLYVPWYRYNYEDQEYEYAGTFRRYFFINGDDEEATSIEQVKFITALYPDTPVSHDEVQIQGTKQSKVLNRELTTFSLTIDGLVPDSDTETTDYVVRVRIIGDGGPGKTVPWCHVGNVGYSYLLKTVPEDGRWAMEAHVLGSCLRHQWPDTLQVELFSGSDLTNYSEPIVFDGSYIISYTGELQYPEYGTHEFIAGKDIALGALPNSQATGVPAVSGTAQVGETLTAGTSSITDTDGLDNVSFSYQWLSSRDTAIQGATGSTYTLVSMDVGKIIKVRVSFTDDEGNEESLTSAPTAAVAARLNSPATGQPSISGTAQVGETLTADTSGIADADGLDNAEFSYQWVANDGSADSDIQDATGSTYTLADDEGKTIKVRVSFTDDAENQESLTSVPTETVDVSELHDRPYKLQATVAEGAITLTWQDPDTHPGHGLYHILRHRPELGEDKSLVYVEYTPSTDRTFTDSAVEPGVLYVYAVKAVKDPFGFLGPASDPVEVRMPPGEGGEAPNSPATGQPTISGTAQVGETLTASVSAIEDADGLENATFSYQWLSSRDTEIQGANASTYTLVSADVGKIIKVLVSFTDNANNQETLTSTATAAVSARPNSPPASTDGICGRTQEVQDAIVDKLTRVSDCAEVTDSHLAGITWRLTVRFTSSQAIKSDDFAGLSALTELQLISDQISALPEDVFGGLDSLEVLLISISELQELPDNVFDGLGSLRNLTVGERPFRVADEVVPVHQLSALPEDVFDGLDSLEELHLYGNQLTVLPEDVFDGLDSLELLNLVDNQLSALPEDVFDGLDSLEGLYLHVNNLSALPEDVFDGLDSLETLTLSNNQLTTLSEDVFDDLGNLEGLGLSRNQITTLPEDLFDGLDSLDFLNFSNNQITTLPEDVFDGLGNLQTLLMEHNQITGLRSDVFDGLSRLYRLELGNNQVAELPDGIFDGIGALAQLYLGPNPGAPFIFTAELEQQGDDAVVVGVAKGAPSDMSVSLSAEGGLLSAETVTVAAGSTSSDPITVTPSGDGDVTVSVDSAEFVGEVYGLGHARTGLGDSLTLTIVTSEPSNSNSPATGQPTISGTAQVDETLTASTSGITDADGLSNVAYGYQWLAADAEIAGATSSSYTLAEADEGKTIRVKVSFTDDSGNSESLTSVATADVEAPLTAELRNVVESHNGQNTFTFRILFSEPVTVGFQALKTDSFEISNGTITRARRVNDRNDLRQFTVRPSSDLDVVMVLPADRPCDDEGAICTSDGKRLSNRLELTVAGPVPTNVPATGAPTISGTAQVGQILTAATSDIADSDGLVNAVYGYQWVRNDGGTDAEIQGATGSTYTLDAADEGKTVKVRVSFTDDAGNEETLTSAGTAAVEARPNSPATGVPTISGTAQVGETLTASTSGIADADGLSNANFAYEWMADDSDIAGATDSTYTLTPDDLGKSFKVRVTFTDAAGNEESLTSVATDEVEARPNSPATGQPTISGTAQVGETLTTDTSGIADEDGLDNASFAYQWMADDSDIAGATDSTYTLDAGDEGKAIKLEVSFTDDANNQETLTSAVTSAVAAAATPLTASLENTPQTHDGQTAFTFELRFSEHIADLSYITLRDDAFTVTGGQVTKARRMDPHSDTRNIHWEITVTPSGNGDVTIVLPVTTNCDDQGAICAGDGRMLSNRNELTVSGPGG